ncbi:MAG: hypothetical protein LAT76_08590 [Schleiferiaceae bacterium]|nr:hypothetical protein [Schleiferiaceae bacterium]
MKKRRKFLLKAVALLISGVVALLLCEVILRVLEPNLPRLDNATQLFCKNTAMDYRMMRKNVVGYVWTEESSKIKIESNSHGFRDEQWTSKADSGSMFLGDSFGWGWGCHSDSMITSVVQSEQVVGDVYNLCIPGDDLVRIHQRYQLFESTLAPKQVVILNYINDFFNVAEQQKRWGKLKVSNQEVAPNAMDINCDKFYKKGSKGFLNQLYLYRFAVRFWGQQGKAYFKNTESKAFVKAGFSEDVDFLQDSDELTTAMAFYQEILEEMALQHPVTVVYIPPYYAVDSAKEAQLLEAFEVPQIPHEEVPQALDNVIREIDNVTFIDLTEFLETASQEQRLYFNNDAHLNNRGQYLVGEYLVEQFEQMIQE